MELAKLMQNVHKRVEIPYSIPNSTHHSWASETSMDPSKFPWTAKEAQITRSHVDIDFVDSFSEFNCLSSGNHFGMF